MNIRGQYNKLEKWQRRILTSYAIEKNWYAYWGFKYFCLKKYEEQHQNLA